MNEEDKFITIPPPYEPPELVVSDPCGDCVPEQLVTKKPHRRSVWKCEVIGHPEFVGNCEGNRMPSVACPICACILCFPLGIATLVYYLQAKSAKGNCYNILYEKGDLFK